MKSKYKCKICNKNHEFYFGIRAPLNEELQRLLDDESDRILHSDGIYFLNKKSVIFPGVIEIETYSDKIFFYETWVSFEINEFIGMSERIKRPKFEELQGEYKYKLKIEN